MAIIGTGAISVQIILHPARYVEHLYVIQRTPSAVDERHQWETDPEWFRHHVAKSVGWQRERLRNLHEHFTTEQQPAINLVNDEWTHAVGMVAVSGNANEPKTIEELPGYMQKLHALDLPRQNRNPQRVEKTIKDVDVAKKNTGVVSYVV